jgi:hypothetical protein
MRLCSKKSFKISIITTLSLPPRTGAFAFARRFEEEITAHSPQSRSTNAFGKNKFEMFLASLIMELLSEPKDINFLRAHEQVRNGLREYKNTKTLERWAGITRVRSGGQVTYNDPSTGFWKQIFEPVQFTPALKVFTKGNRDS